MGGPSWQAGWQSHGLPGPPEESAPRFAPAPHHIVRWAKQNSVGGVRLSLAFHFCNKASFLLAAPATYNIFGVGLF